MDGKAGGVAAWAPLHEVSLGIIVDACQCRSFLLRMPVTPGSSHGVSWRTERSHAQEDGCIQQHCRLEGRLGKAWASCVPRFLAWRWRRDIANEPAWWCWLVLVR